MKVHPEATALAASIGVIASSQEAEAIFASLGTVSRPSLDDDEQPRHYDWVLVRRKGVELGFVDKMYFEAQPEHTWGDDDNLILNQITFYADGARDDVKGWADALPFGLTFTDKRSAVRDKLSVFASNLRTGTRDCWDMDERRWVVTYFPDDLGVESVHVKLLITPWDEAARLQPQLDIQQWISLFGSPAADAKFIDAVTPLDVSARIEEDEDDREVGFLRECGVALYFEMRKILKLPANRGGASAGLVFAAIKFFRARDRDARQWTGSLPLGLDFENDIDAVTNTVGGPPAQRDEGATTGFALWHFAEFSLHVLYSSIDNHLLRVTIMAPGYWQDRAL